MLSTMAQQIAEKTRALSGVVREHAVVTPLTAFRAASESGGAEIIVKCEHLQTTGSFKLRGALAKLLSMGDDQRERGVVTASTGNHGLGVAHALSALGGNGVVCVPKNASPVKVAAIRRYAVDVRIMGREGAETERLARNLAAEAQMGYISPYNDLDVIAGQGTVGEEIVEQLGGRQLDTVVVAVGGGGLIAGVAAAVKSALPGVRVVGASPANDATMAASVRAGQVVEIDARPTISDGTAGGLERDSVTLPLCRELVDEWILISEPEIRATLRFIIDTEHQLVEGSAATAIAAGIRAGQCSPGQTIAIVSCGANISSAALAQAITSAPAS